MLRGENMLNLTAILEYIYTGPTLLLYGAGLSNELGLPTWSKLALNVLKNLSVSETKIKQLKDAEKLLARKKFPETFDLLSKMIGKGVLYKKCAEQLVDPGGIGEAYTALAKIPFSGYLTTNYDDIFERHLKLSRKAVTKHGNEKSEIEQVDFDAVPSIVKLHSDFNKPDTIILTKRQYRQIQFDDKFNYLREFLKSHVLSRRLLIVGYSVSDPEIQLILQEATKIYRRTIGVYAIVSGADDRQIRDWEIKYNIKIFSYPNEDGSHKELTKILKLLAEYSSIEKPRYSSSEDIRSAQHLYMWHKVSFGNDLDSINGAIDSLVLGLICENNGKLMQKIEVAQSLGKFLGKKEYVDQQLTDSFSRLLKHGFLRESNGQVKALPAGINEININIGQFNRLCDVLKQQIIIDATDGIQGIDDLHSEQIANLALNALIDLFKERAVELFNNVFKERPTGINLSIGLFKLLNYHAESLESLSYKTWFINYCSNIMKNPKPHEAELLSYIARAFFCFQVLQLDTDAYNACVDQLKQRICLVDSNIILPLILKGYPANKIYRKTLSKIQEMGVSFYILEDTIREAIRAINWAIKMINQYGERSKEILYAAQGYGFYRPNQVLHAYINVAEEKNISFNKYLADLFGVGATVDIKSAIQLVEKELNISVTDKDSFCDFSSAKDFREKVKEEIIEKANADSLDRPTARIDTEADVYTIIAKWDQIKSGSIGADRCCFLSLGGFLNYLSKSEKVGIETSPVITMDGLGEVVRIIKKPETSIEFSEWIRNSYFPQSHTLLSNKAARKVFSEAIRSSEDEYLENLDSFQELLDNTLSKNYIDEIPELDRPAFVESLRMRRDEAQKMRKEGESLYKEKYLTSEKKADKLAKQVRYLKMMNRIKTKK